MIVLASVALLASVFSFLGTKLSYTAGLGFMKNMQTIVGNKVARLPLGWFQADSAGKLSRMVTQEMISTGQTAAFFIGQLLKNASAVVVFCIATWFWNWQLGMLLTLAIPVLFLLMKISQICVGKGKQLNAPCIVYNLNGYYDGLKAMLKHMIDMGLSSEERQKGIYFAESLEQITDILCSLKED